MSSPSSSPRGRRSPTGSPSQSPVGIRRRTVAIVGSTGGGAANSQALGEENAQANLSLLIAQLSRASIDVVSVVFTSCDAPMDAATDDSPAALWELTGEPPRSLAGEGMKLTKTSEGALSTVNEAARQADLALSSSMPDGVVMISGDVDDVNCRSITAAAEQSLPLVCTGGTGTAKALALSCNVVQGGGSVATTRESRAIAFASALAAHWNKPYSPKLANRVLDPHSLLDGCLPAFLAMVLLNSLVAALPPALASAGPPMPPGAAVLTTVMCVVAAHQTSHLGEIGIIAGSIAAVLVAWPTAADALSGGGGGSVVSGLVAGVLAGGLCPRCLSTFFRLGFPATGATIAATGLSGTAAGLLVRSLSPALLRGLALAGVPAPLLDGPGAALRLGLSVALATPAGGAAFGSLAALWFVFGSKVGHYHLIFLPLILLEMEDGTPPFLGALDCATLCMVSAGVCAASVLAPRDGEAESTAARHGLRINVLFGDYIEAAYPLMERDPAVNVAAYLGAAIAGALLGWPEGGVGSSAYLPLPLALGISTDVGFAAAAFGVAFGLPFVVALLRNWQFFGQAAAHED